MRKVWLVVGSIIVIALAWYLFVMPYEARASFKVKAYPGTVIQILKTWSNSCEDCQLLDQDSIFSVKQRITNEQDTYIFDWKVQRDSDSSEVTIHISKETNGVAERISSPFYDTPLEQKAKELIREFRFVLYSHLERTNVNIVGIEKFDSTFCVCIPIRTTQYGKAYGMMRHYNDLSMHIKDQGFKPAGVPLVEVTSWKMSADQVEFNFCYPLVYIDSIQGNANYLYKWLTSGDMLKAVYNGNYMTSDRAWFELLNYAQDNNLKTTKKPIEVFYDNPNFGMKENEWKAEIFLPLEN